MNHMTIYSAGCRGNPKNCLYPAKHVITNAEELKAAVAFDNVCACYRNDYRSSSNFISSDCLPFDCDNDHSEKAEDWKTPEDVRDSFPGTDFYVIYSRNHNKDKNGKSPRPRFHIYFPMKEVGDSEYYRHLKGSVTDYFPYFDAGARDAARFFFGIENPQVEYYGDNSSMDISEFMRNIALEDFDSALEEIPEGRRNSTLSQIAGRLIKRYGDTDEARSRFLDKAENCNPPLGDEELDSIWRSAQGFGKRVSSQADYIPPEKYNCQHQFKPSDFSDTAQAVIFTEMNNDRLAFSHGTGYLVYDGAVWEESKSKPRDVYHEFTDLQLEEAESEVAAAKSMMKSTGAESLIRSVGKNKAIASFTGSQAHAYFQYLDALEYRSFALQRRNSNYVGAALKESEPMVEIDPKVLDEDAFLLNTPSSTIDLRIGVDSAREHSPKDMLTRCTSVSPGEDGKDIWLRALDTFFGEDDELKAYVQKIAGLSLIGNVYVEALIIAYGAGKNGKSTFWNSLLRVLGTYGGNISAEALTVGCRTNIKPELAEMRGKRLIIAAELEEGTRLSTSAVKKFCSTDEIVGEKKFLKPLSFRPSHNLVLYTNHLPKVGANDPGTWRRLIVVPFTQTIEGSSDIKNFSDYLVDNAGSYILTWMIEGAQIVIADDYHIEKPACVTKATDSYRENSDWLEQFIAECCDTSAEYHMPSGEFYQEYRAYCTRTGDYIRSSADFYSAVEHAGFERKRNSKGRFIYGLRLKTGFDTA